MQHNGKSLIRKTDCVFNTVYEGAGFSWGRRNDRIRYGCIIIHPALSASVKCLVVLTVNSTIPRSRFTKITSMRLLLAATTLTRTRTLRGSTVMSFLGEPSGHLQGFRFSCSSYVELAAGGKPCCTAPNSPTDGMNNECRFPIPVYPHTSSKELYQCMHKGAGRYAKGPRLQGPG